VAFREAAINLLEIPSGAIADLGGRRKSMIVSFSAYIVSFLLFGASRSLPLLFVAMLFFAVGEAFRSGTHKAMIFAWLRLNDRTAERVSVYGRTRSWSKFGSAISVVLAAVFVLISDDYALIFYLSSIPYLLSIVNLLGYPAELDVASGSSVSWSGVTRHALGTLRASLSNRRLRRLVLESMGFEGVFHSVKDYLQPALLTAASGLAVTIPLAAELTSRRQVALLVAPVYCLLHLLSGVASRGSHQVVSLTGTPVAAARALWAAAALIFGVLTAGAILGLTAMTICAFVMLHVLQNFWRPLLIGRLDSASDASQGATLMSVESQTRRLATMILAPCLGLAVDGMGHPGQPIALLPIGMLGLAVTIGFLITRSRTHTASPRSV
jgi:MFS family permease